MRSIQRRFEAFKSKNPNLSSYVVLSHAVKQQRFSRDMISRWFNKLVEKDDYDSKDKRKLIQQLWKLSNDAEDNGLSDIKGLKRSD